MSAVLQVTRSHERDLTTEQLVHSLCYAAARELGLPKKQSEQAAALGIMKVDGIKISITCLETDTQRDAIIVAKLAVSINPISLRELLEINLVAAIALNSTIAIDSDGDAVLLAVFPIESSNGSFLAKHVSQMALFAETIKRQIGQVS